MRILHILDHSIPAHSGYSFRTLAILREQQRLGWDTFHVTSPKHPHPTGAEEHVDGWLFFRTEAPRGWMTRYPGLSEIALMRQLERRIESVAEQVKPDILHAHSPVLNAIPAQRVARRLGLPMLYEVRAFWEDAAVDHGTAREGDARYRMTRALETMALKRADAVTTICEGLRRDIVERGVPADKVTVIPNAVDIDAFKLSEEPDPILKQRLGLNDKVVVGFIGSFYAYEGLGLLLRAAPLMLRRVPNLKLLLVGGGPQEAELRALAAELDVADQVIFTGRVPHDQVGLYYDLIDVLAYPRLSMRLTDLVTPLKPLECMAQGRLLVASDVGGHRELIQDDKTGLLFTAGSTESLARRIIDLIEQPQRWAELRTNARRFVETERTWPISVARYQKVYSHCLKRYPAHDSRARAHSNP
ncbi:MAG TPA: TIGR04063 family PEP-CTERM/XrtA system glycosyltransferase [Burkholderiales bacterium]|nr:TIGR04063 family PEP-CTERM/XrtA system glycosyltransferase [Burkholderiales bacterium]